MTVQLFIPCYLDQCAPALAQALTDSLNQFGIAWNYPPAQTCCGQFAYNAGEWPAARKLMRHFLQVFGAAETVLCPSASCVLTVRHHYNQLVANVREATLLARLQSRLWEWSEWLARQKPLPWPLTFSGTLVLHHSCAARQLGLLDHLPALLGQVTGLTIRQVSPYYSCCGFGGLFSVKCPELSQAIGESYLQAVLDTGAEGLLSQDLSCLMHLAGIIRARHWPLKIYHLAEILAPPNPYIQK
ncbi:MAG: hypothetical protein BZ151_04325 [Desulfobacca sp. 4484_104]|nr:MAG: hypothetical protein BZ151_04325 [Desulfobacca sp. 4484_104]RLA89462.1 MAG: Fe-S oxidoreductase [Deltaproteobacteria bacterium]